MGRSGSLRPVELSSCVDVFIIALDRMFSELTHNTAARGIRLAGVERENELRVSGYADDAARYVDDTRSVEDAMADSRGSDRTRGGHWQVGRDPAVYGKQELAHTAKPQLNHSSQLFAGIHVFPVGTSCTHLGIWSHQVGVEVL